MKSNPRVVFDTNIYLSAFIFGGNPRQCLDLAREGDVKLFSNKSIFFETSNNLLKKFKWSEEDVREVIVGLSKFTEMVASSKKMTEIKHDPDNRVLECAIECDADYIISGDKKHLLSLKKFRKISIISAKKFLDIFLHS